MDQIRNYSTDEDLQFASVRIGVSSGTASARRKKVRDVSRRGEGVPSHDRSEIQFPLHTAGFFPGNGLLLDAAHPPYVPVEIQNLVMKSEVLGSESLRKSMNKGQEASVSVTVFPAFERCVRHSWLDLT